MTEKPHFNYQADIKIKTDQSKDDNFERISRMYSLQPVEVEWETKDQKVCSDVFFLNFYQEKVYDKHLNPAEGALGEGVLKILHEKKNEMQTPLMPEGLVREVLNKKKQIIEDKPDAGEDQFTT
ncbi:MAG: hypothetical protein DWQ19_10580 [Crenarchaeota archaeon]|nr:MAG: hypothetical protein DWQ19_10580 [Thermoproteota archaeon]